MALRIRATTPDLRCLYCRTLLVQTDTFCYSLVKSTLEHTLQFFTILLVRHISISKLKRYVCAIIRKWLATCLMNMQIAVQFASKS